MNLALSRVYAQWILQIPQNTIATGVGPSQGAPQGGTGPDIRQLGRSKNAAM